MYSTVNITRIGTLTDLQNRASHCLRQGGPDASFIGSYRPEDQHKNEHYILGENGLEIAAQGEFNLNAEIEKMRKANNASYRKNAAVATELLLGASKEFFEGKSEEQIQEWAQASLRAAESKFEGKVFAASLHRDESTPHLHVYILPHYQKEVKERKPKEGARKRTSRRKPRVGVSHEKVIGRYRQYHAWYNQEMQAAGYTDLKQGEPMDISGKEYGELKRRVELEKEALIEQKHAVDMRDEAAHSFFERNIDQELELIESKKKFEQEVVRRTNDERIKSNVIERKKKEIEQREAELERRENKYNQRVKALNSAVEQFKEKVEGLDALISRTLRFISLNKNNFPWNWLTTDKEQISLLEDDMQIAQELSQSVEELEDHDENDRSQGPSF